MTGLSSAGEAAVLVPLTAASYVSLHTGDPGDSGANEVVGGGYARQGPVVFASAGSNPTVASNSVLLNYPTATAPWGTVGWFGVWSAATGGSFFGSGTLSATVINLGDMARFPVNALTITVQ